MEFLVQGDEFYFMEMNTRIQVEHPVTEMVTGRDLIKEMIAVAAGQPLSFGQKDVRFTGHAIECRINAEDPMRDFMPCPGKIGFVHLPGGMGVRVDSHVYQGYTISPYYDSMIAKIICLGLDREEAVGRMIRSLEECVVDGVKNTIEFQIAILSEPRFRRGDLSTQVPRRLPVGRRDADAGGAGGGREVTTAAKRLAQGADVTDRARVFLTVSLGAVAVFTAVALATLHAGDWPFDRAASFRGVENLTGPFGSVLAFVATALFGRALAWVIPVLLVFLGGVGRARRGDAAAPVGAQGTPRRYSRQRILRRVSVVARRVVPARRSRRLAGVGLEVGVRRSRVGHRADGRTPVGGFERDPPRALGGECRVGGRVEGIVRGGFGARSIRASTRRRE